MILQAADGVARREVVSSYLASVGYSPTRHVLAVEFKDGAIFHYADVDEDVAKEFLEADSLGRFFLRRVKGRFSAVKMTGPCAVCGRHGIIGQACETPECEGTPQREETGR